ncbi:helix-turn-helix transcriptional regulator [Chitinophaga sp.]|uniref:response regulator transcription factor n=1 Tax=Chitinophaga sp. TaxID=1869181 RepID=UPI0031E2FD24
MIARIGLLTGGVILLFQIVNLLVVYRYVRLDFYLCLVAVFFLIVGWSVHKWRGKEKPKELPVSLLSAKEWKILQLVAEGKTNKEIAAIQFVELSTIKTHLNNIYKKLSVTNRKEARERYLEVAPQMPVE